MLAAVLGNTISTKAKRWECSPFPCKCLLRPSHAQGAEDLIGWPIPGDDEWSAPDVTARHLDRRPLTQCPRSREKEQVVIVIDTSGSCLRQARFFSSIATAAVAAGDVELCEAPNDGIRGGRGFHQSATQGALRRRADLVIPHCTREG